LTLWKLSSLHFSRESRVDDYRASHHDASPLESLCCSAHPLRRCASAASRLAGRRDALGRPRRTIRAADLERTKPLSTRKAGHVLGVSPRRRGPREPVSKTPWNQRTKIGWKSGLMSWRNWCQRTARLSRGLTKFLQQTVDSCVVCFRGLHTATSNRRSNMTQSRRIAERNPRLANAANNELAVQLPSRAS
jgi:hypothetical protein